MTAMTQSISDSQSVHCESQLQRYWLTRWIELFTAFDASFSAAFDFRGFFSGTPSLCLKIDGTAIDVKTRLSCTAKHKLLSALEFRRSNRHAEQSLQSTRIRSTCQAQTPHKFGSLGKRKSQTLSLGMFPQPAHESIWCSLMTKNVRKPSLHPSVIT